MREDSGYTIPSSINQIALYGINKDDITLQYQGCHLYTVAIGDIRGE